MVKASSNREVYNNINHYNYFEYRMSGHHIASNINFNDDLNDEEELIDYCLAVRKWPVYLLSGVFAFLALFIPVLLWRVLSFICCRKEPDTTSNCFSLKSPKNWLGEPLSSQTKLGRILVSRISK